MNKFKLVLIIFFWCFFITIVQAKKKIAILPFDIPNNVPEMKQFGVGTMDTITIALTNVPEFIMVDRGQLQGVMKEIAFQNSGFVDSKKAIQAGKLLGAEVLVTGSIQKEHNNYRITAKFIEVETGTILNALQVTGSSIFSLQDQLTFKLINQQKVHVTKLQKKKINNVINSTKKPKAYNFYIKGLSEFNKYNESGFINSINYYDKALNEDKNYKLAISSKAESLALLSYLNDLNSKPFKKIINTARETALKGIKVAPDLGISYRALSIIHNLSGEFSEGRKAAEKAISLNKNDAEAYYWLWVNSPKNSSYHLIEKALALNPFLTLTHSLISYSYVKNGRYDEAIKISKEALKVNSSLVPIRVILGFAYYKNGDFIEALTVFEQIYKINPNLPSALTGLALVYNEDNRSDEGISLLKKSIKINPKYSYAYSALGYVYYSNNKKGLALQQYYKGVEANPDDIFSRNGIGYYFLEKGYLDKALENFKRALEINPNDADTNYNIGLVYKSQKKYNLAIKWFKKSIDLNSKLSKSQTALEYTYILLGNKYLSEGKVDYSIFQFNEALKLNSKNGTTYYNLAIAYSYKKNNDYSSFNYKMACDLGINQACSH